MPPKETANLSKLVNDFLESKKQENEGVAFAGFGESGHSLAFSFASQAITGKRPDMVLRMMDEGFTFDTDEVDEQGRSLLTMAISYTERLPEEVTAKWVDWWNPEQITPTTIIQAAKRDPGVASSPLKQKAVVWRVLVAALLEKGFNPWPTIQNQGAASRPASRSAGKWGFADTPIVDPWSAACVRRNIDMASMLLDLPNAPSPDDIAGRSAGVTAKEVLSMACDHLRKYHSETEGDKDKASHREAREAEISWLCWAIACGSSLRNVLDNKGASLDTPQVLNTLPSEWSPDTRSLSSLVKHGAVVPGFKENDPEKTVDFALSFATSQSSSPKDISDSLEILLNKAKNHMPKDDYEAYQKGFLIRIAEKGTAGMFQKIMKNLKPVAKNWTSCTTDRGRRGKWSLVTAIFASDCFKDPGYTRVRMLQRLLKERRKGSPLVAGGNICPGLTDEDLARLNWMGPLWNETSQEEDIGKNHPTCHQKTQEETDRIEFIQTCIAARKCLEKDVEANSARMWLWLSLVLAAPPETPRSDTKSPSRAFCLTENIWVSLLGFSKVDNSAEEENVFRRDAKISPGAIKKVFDDFSSNMENRYLRLDGSLCLKAVAGATTRTGGWMDSCGFYNPETSPSGKKAGPSKEAESDEKSVVKSWSRVPVWRVLAKIGEPDYEQERAQWRMAVRDMLRKTTKEDMRGLLTSVSRRAQSSQTREPFYRFLLSPESSNGIIHKALWAVVNNADAPFWADVGMTWLRWNIAIKRVVNPNHPFRKTWQDSYPECFSVRSIVNLASNNGWKPDPVLLKDADSFVRDDAPREFRFAPSAIRNAMGDYRDRLLWRLLMKQEIADESNKRDVAKENSKSRLKM